MLESLEPPIGPEPGLYTLAVTVDLSNAREWKERPDTTCAGFPSALASRSYRAQVNEAAPGSFDRSVTAEDPTLRWPDLFTFVSSGSFVQVAMEGGPGSGIAEDLPGFRYLEIGGFVHETHTARGPRWIVDLDPV